MLRTKIISIFGLDKKYLLRQLKNEIKKFDESIEDLISYQNAQNYIKTILTELLKISDNQKAFFILKEIINLDDMDSYSVKDIAYKYDISSLYFKMKEKNLKFTPLESLQLKKMLIAEFKRPRPNQVENIAFSGGGAKGIAHVGTIRKIEESGLNIKAVSGTSAGAITALPYALGYKPNKIAEIVANYDFTSFLQESTLNDSLLGDLIKLVSSSKRALMYRTLYFNEFKKQIEEPFIKFLILKNKDEKVLKIEYPSNVESLDEKYSYLKNYLKSDELTINKRRSLLSALADDDLTTIVVLSEEKARKKFRKEILENEKKISPKDLEEKLSLGFKNPSVALQSFFRLYKKEDVIEEFFGDLIENKITHIDKKILESVSKGLSEPERIRQINFKEFEELRKACPEMNFKDIAICICQKVSDSPLKLFLKENYKQIDVSSLNEDSEYSEMPLKTAVRISMNLPGAFSSYKYKNKKYVDGGVRANFPLHFFDKTKNIDREKTLGFALAPEDNYTRTSDVNNLGRPESPTVIMDTRPLNRFFKKLTTNIGHYYSHKIHGQKLDNNNPFDQIDLLRVGIINVLDVGTNDFNISKESKIALMQEGYKTCKNLLSPNYEAQLFHHIERVKAIKQKILTLSSNKVLEKDIDTLYENNYNNISENMVNPVVLSLEKENSLAKKNFFKKIKYNTYL